MWLCLIAILIIGIFDKCILVILIQLINTYYIENVLSQMQSVNFKDFYIFIKTENCIFCFE